MPYHQYGTIDAATYNTFSVNTNKIYGDNYPGATSLPEMSYGYGQTPALSTPVPVGSAIQASQWASLFAALRQCGNHQGTPVVPPLPGIAPGYGTGSTTLPAPGGTIIAYNTPGGALTTLIDTIGVNRYNILAGQTAFTSSQHYQPASTPWTNALKFKYKADFGTWDNARHFFNSGGFLTLSGDLQGVHAPTETPWNAMFKTMSPLKFDHSSTTPRKGRGGTNIGFYNLSTTPQTIYRTQSANNGPGYYYYYYYYSGAYSQTYITVTARLVNTPGTNGQIEFEVSLDDYRASPSLKYTPVVYTLSEFHSAGAINYNGTIALSNQGFTSS